MVTQIFKKDMSEKLVFNFLEKFCDKNDNYLLLNKSAYRKAEYHNYIQPFLDELKEYYHTSKQFYLTRKLTYNYFLTIIRQLCKYVNIKYDTKILYVKSLYDINYHIYIN